MKLEPQRFEAIGTKWEITPLGAVSAATWDQAQMKVRERIDAFDRRYSRFRGDSWVSQLRREPGRHELPDDAYPLLEFYQRLYEATGGLVTPLIGDTMEAAGYDAAYSWRTRSMTPPPGWAQALELTRTHLTLKLPVLLDVGAAGKGYLIDLVGEVLEQAGVAAFLINAGGDLLHRDPSGQGVRVGLENPQNRREAVGVVELSNQSLCASSGRVRHWGAFHHIINPRTLQSPHEVIGSWALAPSAMVADGLATALFLVEPRRLVGSDFAWAVLSREMRLQRSPDFVAEVFTESPYALRG